MAIKRQMLTKQEVATSITVLSSFIKTCNIKDIEQLLTIFLTPNDINDLANRILIVDQLLNGTDQKTIATNLQTGVATITKGSKVVQAHTDFLKKVFNK